MSRPGPPPPLYACKELCDCTKLTHLSWFLLNLPIDISFFVGLPHRCTFDVPHAFLLVKNISDVCDHNLVVVFSSFIMTTPDAHSAQHQALYVSSKYVSTCGCRFFDACSLTRSVFCCQCQMLALPKFGRRDPSVCHKKSFCTIKRYSVSPMCDRFYSYSLGSCLRCICMFFFHHISHPQGLARMTTRRWWLIENNGE